MHDDKKLCEQEANLESSLVNVLRIFHHVGFIVVNVDDRLHQALSLNSFHRLVLDQIQANENVEDDVVRDQLYILYVQLQAGDPQQNFHLLIVRHHSGNERLEWLNFN